MNQKYISIALVAILVIAVGGYFFPEGKVVEVFKDTFGALGTRYPTGITIGTNGTDNVEVAARTCDLAMGSPLNGFAASTTRWFNCSITGITSGDIVFGTLPINPSGSLTQTNYFTVGAVKASSTAGLVDVQLFYAGNVSTSSFAQATTSFQVLFFDTTR